MSGEVVPHTDLLSLIESFDQARVLCIGDIMLDRFMYGEVTRISPEAPIPVFRFEREDTMLGGAGNVVRNLLSLGAQTSFIGVIGDDEIGRQLMQLVSEYAHLEPYVFTEKGRLSTQKLRYIASQQQLLRADHEQASALSAATIEQMLSVAESAIEEADAVILSDYGKGVITRETAQKLIAIANEKQTPIFVDPKSNDFSDYAGATLLSPNYKEFNGARAPRLSDDAEAAEQICTKHNIQHLLVTRGKDGMTLYDAKNNQHIPTQAREVFDVSGAGDTVIATLALAFARGASMGEAAQLANAAAGIVVGKLGTATIYRTDLKTALHTSHMREGSRKIYSRESLTDQVANWQKQGLTVGFTNGCFDVVHAGHIQLLEDAKANCDRLVLGLNSDDSVKRLKGDSRPINQEMDRAMLLAAIGAVDAVSIFREDTPMQLLEKIRPDVLMKGADYSKDQVVGGEWVESYGGKIVLLELKEGYSTTNTIKKMQTTA